VQSAFITDPHSSAGYQTCFLIMKTDTLFTVTSHQNQLHFFAYKLLIL